MKFKAAWEYVQGLLDLNGDVVMLVFSGAVMWKILHVGLNPSDAAAYASAVACFAYSNTGKGPRNS
jgi:hypothetical protein